MRKQKIFTKGEGLFWCSVKIRIFIPRKASSGWNCVLRKYCNAVLLYFFGFGTWFLGLVHLGMISLLFPSTCWMPDSGSDMVTCSLGLLTSVLEPGKEEFNLFHVAHLQMLCISLFSLQNMDTSQSHPSSTLFVFMDICETVFWTRLVCHEWNFP